MGLGYAETFELNGVKIKTTVTSDENKIKNHISSFLLPSKNHETKVIGLDAEWSLIPGTELTFTLSKCATLQFCDGKSCLIIQLNHLGIYNHWASDSVHKSLLNFLHLPNVTFVGVGNKENLAKLEKYYGFGCRNAVELGLLAASTMMMPRLSFCDVDELAFLVSGIDLREHRLLTTVYDWGCDPLSRKLAKLATVNVYSYFKIGSTLLQPNVVG